jgi:hypothetical protein
MVQYVLSLNNDGVGRFAAGQSQAAIASYSASLRAAKAAIQALINESNRSSHGPSINVPHPSEPQSSSLFVEAVACPSDSITPPNDDLYVPGGASYLFTKSFKMSRSTAIAGSMTQEHASTAKRTDMATMSACIVFNMALAHHMAGLQASDGTASSAAIGDRQKAYQLYRQVIHLLRGQHPDSNPEPDSFPLFVLSAALNNMGVLTGQMGSMHRRHLLIDDDETVRTFQSLIPVLYSPHHPFATTGAMEDEDWAGITGNCFTVLMGLGPGTAAPAA